MTSDWNRRRALEAEAQMLNGPSDEPKFHNAEVNQLSATGFASQGKKQNKAAGEMLFNPPTEMAITAGDHLIVMGATDRLQKLEQLLTGTSA